MNHSIRSLALLALLVTSAAPATAQILPSLDRATFQAAAPSLTMQNFDSLADGATIATVNGVTYGSSVGTPVITNTFVTSTSPNGLGRTTQEYFSASDTATFLFDTAITAFAIDINTYATTNGSYDVILGDGAQAFSIFESFPGFGTGQFIGFVSDTPFTSVSLTANTGFSFTLDTLLYGSRTAIGAVPEPGTWAMMLLGFGAVGFSLRRRRRMHNLLQVA